MIFVLEDGRVLSDKSLIGNELYIELPEYPDIIYQDRKVGVIIGIENNAIKYNFVDEVLPERIVDTENPIVPIPTDQELFQAEILLTQQDMIIAQQSQDEVLAAILLAQQAV